MKKTIYIYWIFSVINIITLQCVNSQTSDPLDSIFGSRLCTFNDNSYLIREDVPYTVQIKEIIKLHNGCCFISSTIVDSFDIVFPIVTPLTCENIKIKKDHSYILHLYKYFLIPSVGFDKKGLTVDIMLDGRIITLNDGLFSYWFISPDIDNGHILSPDNYYQKKLIFEQNKGMLLTTIEQFLDFISYNNTVAPWDIMDTLRIKQTMISYGKSVWSIHSMKKSIKIKEFFSPKNRYGTQFFTLNDKTPFLDVLKELLKRDYQLPVPSQFRNINIKNVKLLDYSLKNHIWTIQVIWEVVGSNKRYLIILAIRNSFPKPLIVGFNRTYYGYHLEDSISNHKYIPIF